MLIGVFCSGGDAPGMNACVRATVRTALALGHEVVGIRQGYQGLLDESFYVCRDGTTRMDQRSVSGIARLGGTILGTSRSDEFRTLDGQRKAAAILQRHGIQALVAIGGDGTFRGGVELAKCWNGQIIGCPGTIDNDLCGSDFTIGFSTAVQTAVEAVDKIRDTAESHERMFLVEVMGRHSGYIAVHTALAGSAEVVCVPETNTDIRQIVRHLIELKRKGKQSIILIVAEGDERGDVHEVHRLLQEVDSPYPSRVMVLGHLQRGGSPSPEDRILATQTGEFAVRAIHNGSTGAMAGVIHGESRLTPFPDTFAAHRKIPADLLSLLETMSV